MTRVITMGSYTWDQRRRKWPGAILRSVCSFAHSSQGCWGLHSSVHWTTDAFVKKMLPICPSSLSLQGSYTICDLQPVGSSSIHKELMGSRDSFCGMEALPSTCCLILDKSPHFLVCCFPFTYITWDKNSMSFLALMRTHKVAATQPVLLIIITYSLAPE